MKLFFSFYADLWRSRFLIWQLTNRSLTQQYKRSYLGMIWSIGEPLLFMLVLYIVFGIGLKGGQNMDLPFICYLVTGLSVNNFFSTILTKGSTSIIGHSYLLKKVTFRMGILPFVVVLTGIIEHLLFLIPVVIIVMINSYFPNIYWLQILYYLFSLGVFLIGLTLITSSIGVFFPDLKHIVRIISRVVFYFSPIFWDIESLPESLRKYVFVNPLYYIMMGYRESFFYKKPFWVEWELALYFWSLTVLFIVVGVFSFRKLRPRFSDYV